MRRREYYVDDDVPGTPWEDWPCVDDQDHSHPSLSRADSGNDCTYILMCDICGLSVEKSDECSEVLGYKFGSKYRADLQEVNRLRGIIADHITLKFGFDIGELCKRVGVARLDLFGSATTELFDRYDGDMDVLVRFDVSKLDPFAQYFDLKEGLELIFDRDVILVMESAIKKPYFHQFVDRTKKNIYAA